MLGGQQSGSDEAAPEESDRHGEIIAAGESLPRIAGYELKRQIGRGGSATVHLAREIKHDRLVALKVLHPALAASLQAERFLREISIIAKLSHPNILPLLDSGSVGGQLYYVTPYVEGESLRSRLERERRLPAETAKRLAIEVAGALDYAHRQGLVHRDVKPENILLADGHALVADFGIARALSLAGDDRLTAIGIAVGTPRYMSPEQAEGKKVDGRTDVYSLGCVLYELLAGAVPFDGETAQEIVAQHLSAPVPSLRHVRPRLPTRLTHAIDVALAKRPEDRFATAAVMSDALAVDSLTWQPQWVAGRLRRFVRQRHIALVAAVVLIATALYLTNAGGMLQPGTSTVPRDTTRLALIPIGNGVARTEALNQARLLYEAISGWQGVTLVDQFQITEAVERSGTPSTIRNAGRLAESLGAGRFILVRTPSDDDSIRVEALLYEVGGRSALYRVTDAYPRDVVVAPSRPALVAQRLLLRGAIADSSHNWAAGSRQLPAVQAFGRGQDSLSRWNLQQAETAFQEALEFDPSYARANLWLAQVRAWRDRSTARDWYALAEKAVLGGAVLSHREQLLASALVSLSRGQFDIACTIYEELRAGNEQDFGAWFGLGQCRSMDQFAVRDSRSPSSWRMRSSYQAAVTAYERALELLPSAYAGYEADRFAGMRPVLPLKTTLFNARALPPDTGRFLARIALLNDTLALIPYPFSVISLGGPRAIPPGFAAANANRVASFRRLTAGWSSSFPRKAGPKREVALALEMLGDPNAIDTLNLARRLESDPVRKAELASAEVLLRVKFATTSSTAIWSDVRRFADSLLREEPRSSQHATALAPLASLLGRCDQAEALSRRESRQASPPMSQGLVEAADLHFVRTAIGCSVGGSVPTLRDLVDQVDQESRGAGPGTKSFMTAMLLQRPALFSWPIDSASIQQVASQTGLPLLVAASAISRSRLDSARLAMAGFSAQYAEEIGVSPDVAFPAARLHIALGDTTAAMDVLDHTLGGIRSFDPWLLGDPIVAAALVQAMVLRADLAHANGDRQTAARWGGIVAALWSDADNELQSVVRRVSRYSSR